MTLTQLLVVAALTLSSAGAAAQTRAKPRPSPKPKVLPLPKETVAETLGLERGEADLVAPIEKLSPANGADAPEETERAESPRPVSRPIISGPTRPKRATPARANAPTPTPTPTIVNNDADDDRPPAPISSSIDVYADDERPMVPTVNTDPAPVSSGAWGRIRVRNSNEKFGERIAVAPRVHFGVHAVASRWRQIAPSVPNGSLAFEIGASREFASGLEGRLGFLLMRASTNSTDRENVGAFTVNADLRVFPWGPSSFRPFGELGLAFGEYLAWSVMAENEEIVIFRKNSNGLLFGLRPALGMRFAVTDQIATDLRVGYDAFFDNPNYRIGGWIAGVNLSLTR